MPRADALAPLDLAPEERTLIELAENTERLPEELADLGRETNARATFLCELRTLCAYPLLVCYASFLTFTGLAIFIMPQFAQIHKDMFAGEPLPGITVLSYAILRPFYHHPLLALLLILLAATFLVLALGTERLFERIFRRALPFIPGGARLMRYDTEARITRFWAAFCACGESDEAAIDRLLPLAGGILRWNLKRLQAGMQNGYPRHKLMAQSFGLSQPFCQGFLAPEAERADTLREASNRIRDLQAYQAVFTAAAWRLLANCFMGLSVATIVLGFFMPLIELLDALGG